jgi:hypothetical protein
VLCGEFLAGKEELTAEIAETAEIENLDEKN